MEALISDNLLNNLYRAAAKVEQHEKIAAELFAERQAVVDAALAKWETDHPDKAKALEQHHRQLQDWQKVYEFAQARVLDAYRHRPMIGLNGIRMLGREPRVIIHETGLRYFMDEPANWTTMRLFLTVDQQRLKEFGKRFADWGEENRFHLPGWIVDTLTFMDIETEPIAEFDRKTLAALDKPYAPLNDDALDDDPYAPEEGEDALSDGRAFDEPYPTEDAPERLTPPPTE